MDKNHVVNDIFHTQLDSAFFARFWTLHLGTQLEPNCWNGGGIQSASPPPQLQGVKPAHPQP